MIDLNIQKTNFTKAKDIEIPKEYSFRMKSGISDIDSFIGGGFVSGQTFTLAGTAGSGKTTFLLQILDSFSKHGINAAYISGEEPVHQLAFTSKRINTPNVLLSNMNVIEDIFDEVEKNDFHLIVLDSFPSITSRKGLKKVQLETYLANYITFMAKKTKTVVGTVLHCTKRGTYKGTTLFPHNVDSNFMFRRNKLDSDICEFEITKNRFGSTGTNYFRMTSKGIDFNSVAEQTIEKKEK
jgi:predicted ATP-dependent serine protease